MIVWSVWEACSMSSHCVRYIELKRIILCFNTVSHYYLYIFQSQDKYFYITDPILSRKWVAPSILVWKASLWENNLTKRDEDFNGKLLVFKTSFSLYRNNPFTGNKHYLFCLSGFVFYWLKMCMFSLWWH